MLGRHPRVTNPGAQTEDEFLKSQFARIRGRHFLYDELIESAKNQYEDYLSASAKARKLDELLGVWGTALAEENEDTEDTVEEPAAEVDAAMGVV